jgi:hypothetical protein
MFSLDGQMLKVHHDRCLAACLSDIGDWVVIRAASNDMDEIRVISVWLITFVCEVCVIWDLLATGIASALRFEYGHWFA